MNSNQSHTPYDQNFNHQADFRVKYRFFTNEEGGRRVLPFQGYRSDLWYHASEESNPNQLFMILPEFENEKGELILRLDIPVPLQGTARMWVIIPERRDFHSTRIQIGTKGYFKEGSVNTAEFEVIEILGLHNNPRF